ncbi:MAG: UPF0175 family protein [Acidobacteria bacterium]|nr:UPF0175 family protein [Acidobacteriota bacterium]
MSVHVEFPDELLTAVGEEPKAFSRQVMLFTLGHLYEQGRISAGLGAQVLGCDRLEFYHLLSEAGFFVIDYPAEELDREAVTSRQIAETRRSRYPETDGCTMKGWAD